MFLVSVPFNVFPVPSIQSLSVPDFLLVVVGLCSAMLVLLRGKLVLTVSYLGDTGLLSLLVAIGITSAVINGSTGLLVVGKLYGKYLITYTLTAYLVFTVPNTRAVANALLLAAVLAALSAGAQAVSTIPVGFGRPLPPRTVAGYSFPFVRTAGVYGTYGQFGMLLLSALPIGFSLLMDYRARIRKLLVAVAISIVFLGMLLSQTRGIWIAAFVVSAFYGGQILARHVSVHTLLGFLISLVLVTIVPIIWIGKSLISIEPATVYERLEVYVFSIRVVTTHPLIGVGYGGFRPIAEVVGIDIAVHNIVLEVLTTTGLLGAVPFGVLLLRLTRRAVWLFNRHTTDPLVRAAPFATLGVLLQAQLFQGLYAYELWITLGLLTGIFLRTRG